MSLGNLREREREEESFLTLFEYLLWYLYVMNKNVFDCYKYRYYL